MQEISHPSTSLTPPIMEPPYAQTINKNDDTTTELPMIVWLTGEETYFNDFSLDADAVMNIIGIKRSRLTQISGRELRVGRARMGRYIRPFYRQDDVTAYIAWTKPTATSKRSSELVERAAQELAHQSKAIKEKMAAPLTETSHQVRRLTARLEANTDALLPKINQLLDEHLNKQNHELLAQERKRSCQQLEAITDAHEQQALQLSLLRELTQSLTTKIQASHSSFERSFENISQSIEMLKAELTNMRANLNEAQHERHTLGKLLSDLEQSQPLPPLNSFKNARRRPFTPQPSQQQTPRPPKPQPFRRNRWMIATTNNARP